MLRGQWSGLGWREGSDSALTPTPPVELEASLLMFGRTWLPVLLPADGTHPDADARHLLGLYAGFGH